MPVTVVAVGTVVLGNTSTLTPAIPSGVQTGDLLLAIGYHRSAVTFTCSTSGWTERYDPGSQSTGSWCLYTATYAAGLDNPTIVASASQSFLAVIIAVRGADTTNIFDVNPSASAFTAPASPYNVTLASFNTNYNGSLAFFGWGSTDDNTWAYQSGGGTQRVSANETAGQDASFCIATKEMPTAGAVGDQVARQTTNGGDAGRRFWFAVRWNVFYTLSAESGSIGLSGQAAGTLKASLVAAEGGGFQTVGHDVSFAKVIAMADPGSHQLTGQSVGLLRSAVMAADSGAYQLTGQSAGLARIVSVVTSPGLYQLAGQSAELLRSISVVTDIGTYQLTGQSAKLLRSILLLGGSGLYAVVGQDVTLTKMLSHILSAESGSYSVVGEHVWLLNIHNLFALSASYNVTGHDVGITRGTLFVAENGVFVIIGQDIKILRSLHIVAEPNAITVTGHDTWIKLAYVLIADSGDCLVMGGPILLEHGGIVYIPYIIYFPREELNILLEMEHIDISIEMTKLSVKIISESNIRFLS